MPIINLVKSLHNSGYKIIFFSGRDSICRNETLEWLDQYIPFDIELYMREMSDMGKDSIIKTELYNEHIKDKYYVYLVIDDRDQVVDMWRKGFGFTCLQVDYGDF